MNIQVISFNCLLKNKAGKIISSTYNREVLTSTVGDNLGLVGLAKGLQNLSKGERRSINLTAQEAYGLYEPLKVIQYPRERLPTSLKVGDFISITDQLGRMTSFKVLQFLDDMVSLDGNHPLAGQDLIFEIEALEARDATNEEIADSIIQIDKQIYH
jgi:FKBP-type peptidyl-prolyl cis-trans isomerase SlyD